MADKLVSSVFLENAGYETEAEFEAAVAEAKAQEQAALDATLPPPMGTATS